MPVAASHPAYTARSPETTTLHRVVRENLETLIAATEEGFASPLPSFMEQELRSYLDCGLLCRGFARVRCADCTREKVVAFSCKGRGFCPSCGGRRMSEGALNLHEHVMPRVALRQCVLTVPYALRARLAYDGALLGAVCRVFTESVLGWYRRCMNDEGIAHGRSGSVAKVIEGVQFVDGEIEEVAA